MKANDNEIASLFALKILTAVILCLEMRQLTALMSESKEIIKWQ